MGASERDALKQTVMDMRLNAQGSFRVGVEALIVEIRRVAAAAESALGDISVDEAWQAVERTVRERVTYILTGHE